MPGARRWKYTTDDGRSFRLRAKAALVEQQNGSLEPKVGGEPAALSDQLPPPGFRPRVAYVTNAGGLTRAVVCYTPGCDLFSVDGTTINLMTSDASATFTGNKHNRSERVPRGIADNS